MLRKGGQKDSRLFSGEKSHSVAKKKIPIIANLKRRSQNRPDFPFLFGDFVWEEGL